MTTMFPTESKFLDRKISSDLGRFAAIALGGCWSAAVIADPLDPNTNKAVAVESAMIVFDPLLSPVFGDLVEITFDKPIDLPSDGIASSFGLRKQPITTSTWTTPVFEDLNGDQRPDLVVADAMEILVYVNKSEAGLPVFESEGVVIATREVTSGTIPGLALPAEHLDTAVAFGDADNDGDRDLICGEKWHGNVVFFPMKNIPYGQNQVREFGPQWVLSVEAAGQKTPIAVASSDYASTYPPDPPPQNGHDIAMAASALVKYDSDNYWDLVVADYDDRVSSAFKFWVYRYLGNDPQNGGAPYYAAPISLQIEGLEEWFRPLASGPVVPMFFEGANGITSLVVTDQEGDVRLASGEGRSPAGELEFHGFLNFYQYHDNFPSCSVFSDIDRDGQPEKVMSREEFGRREVSFVKEAPFYSPSSSDVRHVFTFNKTPTPFVAGNDVEENINMADFNADGRKDLIQIDRLGEVWVHFSVDTGNTFDPVFSSACRCVDENTGGSVRSFGNTAPVSPKVTVFDSNLDGQPEGIVISAGGRLSYHQYVGNLDGHLVFRFYSDLVAPVEVEAGPSEEFEVSFSLSFGDFTPSDENRHVDGVVIFVAKTFPNGDVTSWGVWAPVADYGFPEIGAASPISGTSNSGDIAPCDCLRDLDGDGDLDMVSAGSNFKWWENMSSAEGSVTELVQRGPVVDEDGDMLVSYPSSADVFSILDHSEEDYPLVVSASRKASDPILPTKIRVYHLTGIDGNGRLVAKRHSKEVLLVEQTFANWVLRGYLDAESVFQEAPDRVTVSFPLPVQDGDEVSIDIFVNGQQASFHNIVLHSKDADGDGLPYNWEIAHGLDPDVDDAGGSFQGGTTTNQQAFESGVQASTSASLADFDGDSRVNEDDADPRDKTIDWRRVPTPSFAVIDLPAEDVEDLWVSDFTGKGTILLGGPVNASGYDRFVITPNRSIYPFRGDRPHGGAEGAFGSYASTLIGEKVLVERIVDDTTKDMLWDPVAGSFTEWACPTGYHDQLRDERDGLVIGRNWRLPSLPDDGLRCTPDGNLLPGEGSISSVVARIEENGNVVSDKRYWRKDPQSGALEEGVLLPVASSSPISSATLVQPASNGSPGGEWNLVAGGKGLLISKNKGSFATARGSLASANVRGVTQQGWAWGDQGFWANGSWQTLLECIGEEDISEVNLLGILDTGLAVAKIRRGGSAKLALLVPVDIAPDYNRDGKIDFADRGKVREANPFRWWVNDDIDDGSFAASEDSDIPGQENGNGDDGTVNGVSDLTDFFPLFLDLKAALKALPPGDFDYKLSQADGAMNFVEAPDLIPDADPEVLGAGAYWRSNLWAENYASLPTRRVTAGGVSLSHSFLELLKGGQGILLFEYVQASAAPLELEIWSGSTKLTTVKFHAKADGVENMFRHVNLSGLTGEAIIVPSRTGAPTNLPDSETNDKAFVMIHGYYPKGKPNQQHQRGFYSEIFKRLHQSGSRAKYVAVTWNGATGLDYHRAAYQSFKTSPALAGSLSFLSGNEVTVAAHSLGNLLTSSAIVDEGFRPEHYFLINGAAPVESYNPTQAVGAGNVAMKAAMTEQSWKAYDERFHSPNWHACFPAADNRSKLKWKGRFQDVRTLTNPFNFYSTGEDVVANPEDDDANIFRTIWHGFVLDEGIGRFGWVSQEFIKGGTSIAGVAFQRNHGGWALIPTSGTSLAHRFMGQSDPLNPPGTYNRFLPAAAGTALQNGTIGNEELAQFGYFKRFEPAYDALYAPVDDANIQWTDLAGSSWTNPFTQAQGHTLAGQKDTQWVILASAMPSISFAVAANPVAGLNGADMMGMKTGWPANLPREEDFSNDWQHSDFHEIGLTYVKKMYSRMITEGGLDHEGNN